MKTLFLKKTIATLLTLCLVFVQTPVDFKTNTVKTTFVKNISANPAISDTLSPACSSNVVIPQAAGSIPSKILSKALTFKDTFFGSRLNVAPEIISAAILLSTPVVTSVGALAGSFFALSVLIRSGWFITIVVHEFGHRLFAAVTDFARSVFSHRTPVMSASTFFSYFAFAKTSTGPVPAVDFKYLFSPENLAFLRSLFPFQPTFSPTTTPDAGPLTAKVSGLVSPDDPKWAVRTKAAGGIALNAALAAAAFAIPAAGLAPVGAVAINAILIGSGIVAAVTSISDLAALITGQIADPELALYCGNVFFRLRGNDKAQLKKDLMYSFTEAGKINRIRGEQAAGIAVMLKTGNVLLTRLVNRKRGSLPEALEKSAVANINKQTKNLPDDKITGAGHYRYSTSSAPSEIETQPQIWTPAHTTSVWETGKEGTLVKNKREVTNVITFNGDFDDFKFDFLDGQVYSFQEIGCYLDHVLDTPCQALGDSPKMAGMMDLLICRGMWDAASRYAYQEVFGKTFNNVFPTGVAANKTKGLSNAPSKKDIKKWGEIFDKAFEELATSEKIASIDDIDESTFGPKLAQAVKAGLSNEKWFGQYSAAELEEYTKTALSVFIHNDTKQVLKYFMHRAGGTLAAVVHSTATPDVTVFSARAQPSCIGFDESLDYVGVFSESSTTKVTDKDGKVPMRYRMSLNQLGNGEIGVLDEHKGISVYSMKNDGDWEPVGTIRQPEGKNGSAQIEPGLAPRVIDLHNPDNPYLEPLREVDEGDVVGSEIKDIPATMAKIHESFKDEESFNSQTAREFANLMRKKAKRLETSGPSKHRDIVFMGEENNEAIGREMAMDLRQVFPKLNIGFIHPNSILTSTPSSDSDVWPEEIGPDTIIIGVSQSGQNFQTLNAIGTIEQFRKERQDTLKSAGAFNENTEEGSSFVLTGEVDTLMGAAVGQSFRADAPFCKRILCNHSGRTLAEPSTLAAVSTKQTLTELLYYVMEDMLEFEKTEGVDRPAGMRASEHDLEQLKRYNKHLIENQSMEIIETDKYKPTQINKTLKQMGIDWARNITENVKVWKFTVAYIFITVVFHISVASSVGGLFFTGLNALLGLMGVAIPASIAATMPALFSVADALIYITLSFMATFALRAIEKRPLFDRIGKRTIAIAADTACNSTLLNIYATKLGGMAFGKNGWDVQSAVMGVDFLGKVGIRNTRGFMAYCMEMDLQRKTLKESVIGSGQRMVPTQLKGVQNFPGHYFETSMADITRVLKNPNSDTYTKMKAAVRFALVLPIRKIFYNMLNFVQKPLFHFKTGPQIMTVGYEPGHKNKVGDKYISLHGESPKDIGEESDLAGNLRRSRADSTKSLMASYVFFHAMAKSASSTLGYEYDMSKGQSYAKIQTTASPNTIKSELIAQTIGVNFAVDQGIMEKSLEPEQVLEVDEVLDELNIPAEQTGFGSFETVIAVQPETQPEETAPQSNTAQLPAPVATNAQVDQPADTDAEEIKESFPGAYQFYRFALETGTNTDTTAFDLSRIEAMMQSGLADDATRGALVKMMLELLLRQKTAKPLQKAIMAALEKQPMDQSDVKFITDTIKQSALLASCRKNAFALLGSLVKTQIAREEFDQAAKTVETIQSSLELSLKPTIKSAGIKALCAGFDHPSGAVKQSAMATIASALDSDSAAVLTSALAAVKTQAADKTLAWEKSKTLLSQRVFEIFDTTDNPKLMASAAKTLEVTGPALPESKRRLAIVKIAMYVNQPEMSQSIKKSMLKTIPALFDLEQLPKADSKILASSMLDLIAHSNAQISAKAFAILALIARQAGVEQEVKGLENLQAEFKAYVKQQWKENKLPSSPFFENDYKVIYQALVPYVLTKGVQEQIVYKTTTDSTMYFEKLLENCVFARLTTPKELRIVWMQKTEPVQNFELMTAA